MRIVVALLLCSFSMLGFAQTPTDPSYLKGMELVKANKSQKAIKEFTKAIDKNPNEYVFFVERAKCHFDLQNYQDAYNDLTESLKIKPKNDYVYLLLSRLFFAVNNKQEAINNADMALKYASVDSIRKEANLVRADAKSGLQAHKDACEGYKKVLLYDSLNIAALNNIAMSLLELDKATESLTYLDRIVRIDSLNLAATCNYGYIYQQTEDYTKSIYYYKKALKIEPNNFIALNNLGYSKFLNGNVEEGLVDINASIKINASNSFAYRNRALIYIKKEEKEKACTDLYVAKALGFTDQYGKEVENLIDEHCKK
jgi:tetratricopeptide (TPR) repeat protein